LGGCHGEETNWGCVTPHADFAHGLLIRHLLCLFMLTEMPPLFDAKAVTTSPGAFFHFSKAILLI
jgi:hypothetical protein